MDHSDRAQEHSRSGHRGAVPPTGLGYVRVLDIDRDLAAALSPDHLQAARQAALAAVLRWEVTGNARLALLPDNVPAAPLLVLDGCLLRCVEALPGYGASELLFAGDLLHPREDLAAQSALEAAATWTALKPTRMAVLDSNFMTSIQPWPTIAAALVTRALRRSRRLAWQGALRQIPRADTRILLLFSRLGEDIGHVSRDGVVVRLPVTHAVVADLVSVRRPTATKALGELADRGLLTRDEDNGWVIRCAAPQEPRRLPHVDDPPSPVGR